MEELRMISPFDVLISPFDVRSGDMIKVKGSWALVVGSAPSGPDHRIIWTEGGGTTRRATRRRVRVLRSV